jgi:glyoxylase-like metal-dependent hydrolase (beta-lactamase superfamily II)
VPIPDNPLRYTLCHVLAGNSGLVVVDPGWDTDAGWRALEEGLKAAAVTPADVTGIVATHVHPDHHGLTARLRDASGAWVAMHPAERDSLPARVWRDHAGTDADRVWLAEAGVPPAVAAELAWGAGIVAWLRAMPEPDVLLEDGDAVPLPGRRLTAVWTPGHTPGHLCLYDQDEDVLLTGDHVLPRISPNISLHPHSPEPPLGTYLDSLERTARYDSAEALPAHEYRFHGLASRTGALRAHHEDRCAEILTVVGSLGPATAWQLTERLTWSRGWDAIDGMLRRSALAETLAHLVLLVERGRLSRHRPGGGRDLLYALAEVA